MNSYLMLLFDILRILNSNLYYFIYILFNFVLIINMINTQAYSYFIVYSLTFLSS